MWSILLLALSKGATGFLLDFNYRAVVQIAISQGLQFMMCHVLKNWEAKNILVFID